jgi:AcrR family transcriptional regulator
MAGRPKLSLDAIAERREGILRAAIDVIASKGSSGAQIADVAAALEIGHGTVYRYFENKQELFGAVVRYAIQRIASALVDDAPTTETLDEYRAQVRRVGQRLFELAIEEPALAKLLLFESHEAVDQAFEAFAEITESYLKNGKKRGYFRKDFNTKIAARAINAMILEGARQVLRSEDPIGTRNQWSKEIPELFIRGVEA